MYTVADVAMKLEAVALFRLISTGSKPVTASSKVAVTVNKPDCGSVASEVSTTVGAVASVVTLSWVAAVLPLPAAS